MTARGLGFSILTVVVYFVANQTRVGWLYVITAWMLALLLLSWVLPRLWTRNLGIRRSIGRVAEGNADLLTEEAPVQITLSLQARTYPSYFALVIDSCPIEAPASRRKSFFCPRVGLDGVTLSYDALCYKRGQYTFPRLIVECRGPFGLFRHTRQVGDPLPLRVYPWYLQREERLTLAKDLSLQEPANKAGPSDEVFGTREYRPGDPLRYVHWRSTARRGPLVVKEFEAHQERSLALIFDITREYGSGKETTLEYSVKLAASLARYARDNRMPFRLVAHGAPRGAVTWQQALEYLTGVQANPQATPLAGLLAQVRPGESLVIAAPEPEAPRLGRIAVRTRGSPCIVIEFLGFEDEGLQPVTGRLALGVQRIPWSKGAPPASVISRVFAALDAGQLVSRRP